MKDHIIIKQNDTAETIFEKIKEKTAPAEWKQTILDLWKKNESIMIDILKNSKSNVVSHEIYDKVFSEIINTALNLTENSDAFHEHFNKMIESSMTLRLLYLEEAKRLASMKKHIEQIASLLELHLTKTDSGNAN